MSATDDALDALARKLESIAGFTGAPLPSLLRNEDLAARLVADQSGVKAYANLWDGAQIEREETLGADEIPDGYGITHEAKLELAFCGGEEADRRASYDRALSGVFDLLKADRTLGGAVDWATIGELQGPGSGLVTDGISATRGTVLPIALTFRSSRPF